VPAGQLLGEDVRTISERLDGVQDRDALRPRDGDRVVEDARHGAQRDARVLREVAHRDFLGFAA
jgi:hypothetical protein